MSRVNLLPMERTYRDIRDGIVRAIAERSRMTDDWGKTVRGCNAICRVAAHIGPINRSSFRGRHSTVWSRHLIDIVRPYLSSRINAPWHRFRRGCAPGRRRPFESLGIGLCLLVLLQKVELPQLPDLIRIGGKDAGGGARTQARRDARAKKGNSGTT
jgi:hypothetical protein